MDRTEIKVGMMVVYNEPHEEHELWSEGMEDYIRKPLSVIFVDDSDGTALCKIIGLMLWVSIDWLEPWEGEQEMEKPHPHCTADYCEIDFGGQHD